MKPFFNRLRAWLITPSNTAQATATHFYEIDASEQTTHDARAHLVAYDENLLERSRTQWQFGDWASLAALDRDTLQHHPDRAKLALLAAAGRLQTGQDTEAKQWIRLAQDWGCSKKLISQILIAGVHNSIGRAAALSGQQARSLQHFEAAINTGTPGGDVKLLSQARTLHQLEQLGITNNAVNLLLNPPSGAAK